MINLKQSELYLMSHSRLCSVVKEKLQLLLNWNVLLHCRIWFEYS